MELSKIQLNVTKERQDMVVKDGILIINVYKEVDHHNCEELRKRADSIMDCQNIRNVIFDFKETAFMDSSGIGLVMGRYRRAKLSGGIVVLINMSTSIEKIMTMSGMNKLIKIADDYESAYEIIINKGK